MCYYNGCRVSREEYIRLMQIERQLKTLQLIRPMQSGFDYSDWPIIKPKGKNDIEIVEAHWEFIAPWCKTWDEVKEGRKKFTTLNAVGEKILESRLYRDAAIKRRCLVLSSGFYEWRHYKPDGAKKEQTYPYYITVPSEHDYFYMAGIWQPWTDKETGEIIDTFAIVTTAANDLMEQVHNTKKRMPVILPEELAYEWILGDIDENRIKQLATYQFDSENMTAHSIKKDFKTALEPSEEFEYEELPPLL